jgi:RNA polymerase sigma-70 factor (ECF subfamily)
MDDELSGLAVAEHQHPLDDRDFERELVSNVPRFRRYARSLMRNSQDADDLLQQAFLQAWKARKSFIVGSNMGAWLSRIVRNAFIDQKRAAHMDLNVDDCAGHLALSRSPPQEAVWALHDLERALDQLPSSQREAVLLIGLEGLSYEAAAEQAHVPVGTIRSRVGRGRASLQGIINAAQV